MLKLSILGKFRRSQNTPAPAPDFQVEAQEDIRTETNGILQDLLLALSKVRLGLPGKGVVLLRLRTDQSRELCCPVTRESFGETRV